MGRFEDLAEELSRVARAWGPLPRVLDLLDELATHPPGPDYDDVESVAAGVYDCTCSNSRALDAWCAVRSGGPDPGRARLIAALATRDILAYLRLGGDRALAATHVRRADAASTSIYWAATGLDLPSALERLRALGAVQRIPTIAQLDETRNQCEGDDAALLPLALAGVGAAVRVQVECGEPRHDQIITSLGQVSGGAFTPVNVTQTPRRSDAVPYTVGFDFAGVRHTFEAEWRGDCADVDAAWRAANRALVAAGRPQRFYWLNRSGDAPDYVCFDAALRPALEDELMLFLDDGLTPPRHDALLARLRARLQ